MNSVIYGTVLGTRGYSAAIGVGFGTTFYWWHGWPLMSSALIGALMSVPGVEFGRRCVSLLGDLLEA